MVDDLLMLGLCLCLCLLLHYSLRLILLELMDTNCVGERSLLCGLGWVTLSLLINHIDSLILVVLFVHSLLVLTLRGVMMMGTTFLILIAC